MIDHCDFEQKPEVQRIDTALTLSSPSTYLCKQNSTVYTFKMKNMLNTFWNEYSSTNIQANQKKIINNVLRDIFPIKLYFSLILFIKIYNSHILL